MIHLLPHRVVDVGNSQDKTVRLRVSAEDERAPYLCLSHCWGKVQIVRTLGSNISAFEQEIPSSLLSNTFRDAIEATRLLGFRYIWIDSLCIVQDSAEDWRQESSRMSEYYGGAELTLAATKSKDGHGGLFATHKEQLLQGVGPLGKECQVYARSHVRHFGYPARATRRYPQLKDTDPLIDFPLLTRGWVYQERLLSPRMVHFGEDELVWECLASRRCECHATRSDQDGQWSMDNAALDLPKLALYRLRVAVEPSIVPNIWRFMVMRFTQLDLTFGTDKLPALQGCAAMHMASLATIKVKQQQDRQQSSDLEYVAGLWRGSIFEDLLWHSQKVLPRPEAWRAPSFSWASVDVAVIYSARLATLASEQYQPSNILCKLKEVFTKPVASVLGPVASAHLRLSGVLVPGRLRYSASTPMPDEQLNAEMVSNETLAEGDPYSISVDDTDFVFSADYSLKDEGPHRVPSGSAVHAFRIAQRPNDDDGQSPDGLDFSLILRLVDEAQQKYERIGLLDIVTPQLLELAEKHLFRGKTEHSEITIV